MMGHRSKLINGDEFDALTKAGRRVRHFRAGIRAWIKRKFRRRERHHTLEELLKDFDPDAHRAEMEAWDRMPPVGREVI
jgi:hypothetical protein